MIIYNTGRGSASGFTIVELLIVIVVIGILAAITIVSYNGIQNRTNDTVIKSDLTNMKRQLELYYADNGVYPTSSQYFNGTGGMAKVPISKSSYITTMYNYYYCTDVGVNSKFGIAIRSTSNQTYTISSTDGIETSALPPRWQAACGAYGESTTVANVDFNYGYNKANDSWSFGL